MRIITPNQKHLSWKFRLILLNFHEFIQGRQLAATIGVNVPLHSAEHYYIITKGKFPGVHPMLPVIRDPDA